MGIQSLLQVRVELGAEPLQGVPVYRALDRAVELEPAFFAAGRSTKALALGKLVIFLDGETQRFQGLRAYTPSGRWKVEGTAEPPEEDAQGAVYLTHDFGGEDLCFGNLYPGYEFHEPTRSLRIRITGEGALVIRVGSRVLAGVSREGLLTDLWLEGLNFTA